MPLPANSLPCPCGSGARHDACCGPIPLTPELRHTADDQTKAVRLCDQELQKPAHAEIIDGLYEEFWGEWVEAAADLEEEDPDAFETHAVNMAMWLYYDRELMSGRSAAAEVFAVRGEKIAPGVRNALRIMAESYLQPYQVVKVDPGEGLLLENLWRHSRVYVRERNASEDVQPFDLIVTRVVRGPSGAWNLLSDAYLFPPSDKGLLLRAIESDLREARRGAPDLDEAAFFKTMAPVFHDAWCALAFGDDTSELVTPEGDLVEVVTTRMRVVDRDKLLAALFESEDVRGDEPEWVQWQHDGSRGRSVARIALEDGELVLSALSRKRDSNVRALLERLAPGALEWIATEIDPPHEREAYDEGEDDPTPFDALDPEDRARRIEYAYRRHYERWLDEKIPRLSDHTPREAAASALLRPRLIDLLKGLENLERRKGAAGEPSFDPGYLWAELGLERPEF